MTTVLVLVATLLISSNASAGVTDLRLKVDQIFDVQWNIRNGTLNASRFNYIYSSVNYDTQTNSARRWTAAQTADAGSNDRYIGFFDSTTNPGTYGMAVFNSDGSVYKLINNTGTFRALADGAIFYNGNGMWGTLITTEAGYSLGSSGSWAVTTNYPTSTDLQAYQAPAYSSNQAASPPEPSVCDPSYVTCPETRDSLQYYTNHSQRKQDWENVDTGDNNMIRMEQVGERANISINQTLSTGMGGNLIIGHSTSDDTANVNGDDVVIDIDQYGNDNAIGLLIDGNNNDITVSQTGHGHRARSITQNGTGNTVNISQHGNLNELDGKGHFADVYVAGSNNSVTTTQWNENQLLVVDNIADGNTISVNQKDGENYTSIVNRMDDATIGVVQEGGGDHGINLNLTGETTNVGVNQNSAISQILDITHHCGTLGGCAAISITQD